MTTDVGADAIYRPPESQLEGPASGGGEFGSVAKGLGGDFHFSISEILSEAWALTDGSKGAIVGGFAIYMAISIVANGLSIAVGGIDPGADAGASRELLAIGIQTLGLVLVYPLMAGIMLSSIKRAAGDPSASFSDNFACYDRTFSIIVLMIVQTLLIFAGFLLLIIPLTDITGSLLAASSSPIGPGGGQGGYGFALAAAGVAGALLAGWAASEFGYRSLALIVAMLSVVAFLLGCFLPSLGAARTGGNRDADTLQA